MDWYPREHVRKRGHPPTDWDKEMKKTCGGAAWKRVALERKEWKRMGQTPNQPSDLSFPSPSLMRTSDNTVRWFIPSTTLAEVSNRALTFTVPVTSLPRFLLTLDDQIRFSIPSTSFARTPNQPPDSSFPSTSFGRAPNHPPDLSSTATSFARVSYIILNDKRLE
ncbi:unnamed protein product [Nezara viridula]|uniref:Uncharacterized protein n=1 Tax=Nezara viridula TaxID=85310 RepID=A0A9P0H718_NEZVI|nr:unnamed protein product [Nezara viridula]